MENGTSLERVSALCLRGYTQNQLLRDIDSVSMYHSLEVRVPFLDPVIADIAMSLDDEAKYHPLSKVDRQISQDSYKASGIKRILLDIGTPLLPPGFETRPKRGFALPFEKWLRGPLREVVDDALSISSVRKRGLLDERFVSNLMDNNRPGGSSWAHIWLLLILELWHRQVIESSQTKIVGL